MLAFVVVEFEPWRSDFERSDFRSARVVVMQADPGAVAVQGQAEFLCVKGFCELESFGRNTFGQMDSSCKDCLDMSNRISLIYGNLAAKTEL